MFVFVISGFNSNHTGLVNSILIKHTHTNIAAKAMCGIQDVMNSVLPELGLKATTLATLHGQFSGNLQHQSVCVHNTIPVIW